jgi:hypothetical protein
VIRIPENLDFPRQRTNCTCVCPTEWTECICSRKANVPKVRIAGIPFGSKTHMPILREFQRRQKTLAVERILSNPGDEAIWFVVAEDHERHQLRYINPRVRFRELRMALGRCKCILENNRVHVSDDDRSQRLLEKSDDVHEKCPCEVHNNKKKWHKKNEVFFYVGGRFHSGACHHTQVSVTTHWSAAGGFAGSHVPSKSQRAFHFPVPHVTGTSLLSRHVFDHSLHCGHEYSALGFCRAAHSSSGTSSAGAPSFIFVESTQTTLLYNFFPQKFRQSAGTEGSQSVMARFFVLFLLFSLVKFLCTRESFALPSTIDLPAVHRIRQNRSCHLSTLFVPYESPRDEE